MFKFLKSVFNKEPKVNIQELIVRGAIIIDVRTHREYESGHLKNSTNIPLDELASEISRLDKSKPVITCCATGMRSISAKTYLKSNGFSEVYNGGSWSSLRKYEN